MARLLETSGAAVSRVMESRAPGLARGASGSRCTPEKIVCELILPCRRASVFLNGSRHSHRQLALRSLTACASIASTLRAQGKPTTVGFLYTGVRQDYGWNQAHTVAARQIGKGSGDGGSAERQLQKRDWVLEIYRRIEDWHGPADPERRGQGGPGGPEAPAIVAPAPVPGLPLPIEPSYVTYSLGSGAGPRGRSSVSGCASGT